MAESHVLTALISKRAELAGLIEHHQKEMGRLAGEVAHLDGILKLFSPEIDLRMIRAKAYRTRNRSFRPGECQRMVLDIFRDAQGAALPGVSRSAFTPPGFRPTGGCPASSRTNPGSPGHGRTCRRYPGRCYRCSSAGYLPGRLSR
jgi:hypothetical protein